MDENTIFLAILGGTGDLSINFLIPSLWCLYKNKAIDPWNVCIITLHRKVPTLDELFARTKISCLGSDADNETTIENFIKFLGTFNRMSVDYTEEPGFEQLKLFYEKNVVSQSNFILYFALPPSLYLATCQNIAKYFSPEDLNRFKIVLEKPFGSNAASSVQLNQSISKYFSESSIFRIDHYLEKTAIKNLLFLKFSNTVYESLLNKNHVSCILITMKENFGIRGRFVFDAVGIIKDVIQNHLLQILSYILIDIPSTLNADGLKREKIKVLSELFIRNPDDIIIGQYESYKKEPNVSSDSSTPTYASFVVYSKSERWAGVPIILSAGKMLDKKELTVRIQFKSNTEHFGADFSSAEGIFSKMATVLPNELVYRISPDDAIYLKTNIIGGGYDNKVVPLELDMSVKKRTKHLNQESIINGRSQDKFYIPNAYEGLLLSLFKQDRSVFVHFDEIYHSWILVDKVIELCETKKLIIYQDKSKVPDEEYQMRKRCGYVYHGQEYIWKNE